jgi:hypothetical protein
LRKSSKIIRNILTRVRLEKDYSVKYIMLTSTPTATTLTYFFTHGFSSLN